MFSFFLDQTCQKLINFMAFLKNQLVLSYLFSFFIQLALFLHS